MGRLWKLLRRRLWPFGMKPAPRVDFTDEEFRQRWAELVESWKS